MITSNKLCELGSAATTAAALELRIIAVGAAALPPPPQREFHCPAEKLLLFHTKPERHQTIGRQRAVVSNVATCVTRSICHTCPTCARSTRSARRPPQ